MRVIPAGDHSSATAPQHSHRGAVRRLTVVVLLCAAVTVYLVAAGPTMLSALADLAGASPGWLLAAFGATVASMVAFAALRRYTLAVGGADVPFRTALAVSYAAGAVHTTLPAGAVFSTSYAFRHLRTRGASVSATTWSMTVTGLLSTLSLSAVGMLGLVLTTGTAGSMVLPAAEIALSVAVIIALVRLTRRPERGIHLAYQALIRFNRIRRRPAQTGAPGLAAIVDDLRVIHPAGRDWVRSGVLALANWALDLGCLAACCAAVGVHVSFPALLLTYTAGMAAASLLPLPAGLGAVEAAMTVGLTVAGAAASPALAGVLLYRLLSTGSVVVFGWLVVATEHLRAGTSGHRSAPSLQTGTL